MLSGWAMLAAYVTTAIALTATTALFVQSLITGLGFSLVVPPVVLYAIISVGVYYFAVRDIRFSSRLGLGLEVVSLAVIVLVCFLSWQAHGFATDTKQLSLSGASFSAVGQSIVFGIFSYVGFESAATLGKETRNPTVVIPRALTLLVYIGAAISMFACALASINSFSRILFSLGRYQFVHKTMGSIHAKHQTPHAAVAIGVLINFLVCAAFASHAYTDLLGWFGTLASYGFIFVYFLCSVASPVLLRKTGEATPMVYFMGGLGCLLMLFSAAGSLYPVPAAPLKYLPYGFAAYMLVGAVWFQVLKGRLPQAVLSIEQDLEGLVMGAK